MPSQSRPCCAAVSRFEDAASGAAAHLAPGLDFHLPHSSKQDRVIARVHRQIRSAGVFVDKEDPLPVLASVGCSKDSSLGLGAVAVADGRYEDDVRVVLIDDDASDSAGLFESHMSPGLAAVSGFVDAIADRDITANEALARAGPHDVVVRSEER